VEHLLFLITSSSQNQILFAALWLVPFWRVRCFHDRYVSKFHNFFNCRMFEMPTPYSPVSPSFTLAGTPRFGDFSITGVPSFSLQFFPYPPPSATICGFKSLSALSREPPPHPPNSYQCPPPTPPPPNAPLPSFHTFFFPPLELLSPPPFVTPPQDP